MSCDLTNGRLLGECLVGRAGIKSIYFAKYNDFAALTGIVESGGEITDLGTDSISAYFFDMEKNVGNFEQGTTVESANGTSFITQTVTMTLFNIKPADLVNLNALKKGRWVIWVLDFQDKIRLFGTTRGLVASGGSDVSGVGPGDKKGLDLTFSGTNNDFAVFMADYTSEPFDNFSNVSIVTDDPYGPELNTLANAVSDPGGAEANATTGWTQNGLTGTGANVFQSQAGVVNAGSYAFEMNSNDTPTAVCGAGVDLTAAPFNLINGDEIRISFAMRHVGTGGEWLCCLGSTTPAGFTIALKEMDNTETTFEGTVYEGVFDSGTHRYLNVREISGTNDGGVYFDNLSVKKKL
jgi:hypothetical protein